MAKVKKARPSAPGSLRAGWGSQGNQEYKCAVEDGDCLPDEHLAGISETRELIRLMEPAAEVPIKANFELATKPFRGQDEGDLIAPAVQVCS